MAQGIARLQQLRFPGDISLSENPSTGNSGIAAVFILNDLLVQPEVVPGLSRVVDVVCERLEVPKESLQVFVYASPHFQAECHAIGTEKCIIRMSSALVEALNEQELMFVIGHELGHFLFRHDLSEPASSPNDLEWMMLSRRRELSVDRVGLFSCLSLPSALSAMIKTMSGLTERHLNLDVAGFISQLRRVDHYDGAPQGSASTHPAFIIRCRAVLWLSMNAAVRDLSGKIDQDQLGETNLRIIGDLERYLDGPALAMISEAVLDYSFWTLASAVVRKRAFTKVLQANFIDWYGSERTGKLRDLLSTLSSTEAVDATGRRVAASLRDLEAISPNKPKIVDEDIKPKIDAILFG
jgi:hypothetical protein